MFQTHQGPSQPAICSSFLNFGADFYNEKTAICVPIPIAGTGLPRESYSSGRRLPPLPPHCHLDLPRDHSDTESDRQKAYTPKRPIADCRTLVTTTHSGRPFWSSISWRYYTGATNPLASGERRIIQTSASPRPPTQHLHLRWIYQQRLHWHPAKYFGSGTRAARRRVQPAAR